MPVTLLACPACASHTQHLRNWYFLSFYLPAGRDPDRPAIVWADEATPEMLHSMTLGQLRGDSAHVADALRALGLQPGKVAVRPH
jgi:acyl-coenzyme A synthetase/AMP-(fatty) acid ligase